MQNYIKTFMFLTVRIKWNKLNTNKSDIIFKKVLSKSLTPKEAPTGFLNHFGGFWRGTEIWRWMDSTFSGWISLSEPGKDSAI